MEIVIAIAFVIIGFLAWKFISVADDEEENEDE